MCRSQCVRVALAAALLAVSASAVWATTLSPAAVLRGAWTYDNQGVTVTGTLTRPQVWTSPMGTRYYRFQLAEGRALLAVLAQPVMRCEDGSPATVSGVFRRLFFVEGQVLERIVEATSVECRELAGETSGDAGRR